MNETQRTLQQNKALHVFLRHLCEALNDAGYDIKTTLEHAVDRPWTEIAAKELLWKPIQEAMTGKESTAEANTTDYDAVYHVLSRHLGEKLGVTVPPWPSEWTQSMEFADKLYKNN